MLFSYRGVSALFLSLIMIGVANASPFDAKTTALSGAGVATNSHLESMILNPAAPALFSDQDDFSLRLTGGAWGSDEDDLIDNATALADNLSQLNFQFDEMTAVGLQDDLQQLDSAKATGEAGGGVYLNIPGRWMAVGLYGQTTITSVGMAKVDEADIAHIDAVIAGEAVLNTAGLESRIQVAATAVSEVGLNLARHSGGFSYGMTVKRQRVDLMDYDVRVEGFDEDDVDADEYRTDDTHNNLDVGIQYRTGAWHLGFVTKNLIEQSYRGISGRIVNIEPHMTVGGGYRSTWFTAAVDVDANASDNLATGEPSQFIRTGFEIDIWRWLQLRAGYRTDLKSAVGDTYSAGLGFSPFGVINLDVAVIGGDHDTIGGALQLGFSF